MIECLKRIGFAVARKKIYEQQLYAKRHKKWRTHKVNELIRLVTFLYNYFIATFFVLTYTVLIRLRERLKPQDFKWNSHTIRNNALANYHMGTRFEVCCVQKLMPFFIESGRERWPNQPYICIIQTDGDSRTHTYCYERLCVLIFGARCTCTVVKP